MEGDSQGIFEPVLESEEPGKSCKIQVRLKGPSTEESVRSQLVLRTDDPEDPLQRVPVLAFVDLSR